jgi:hypothetical protein
VRSFNWNSDFTDNPPQQEKTTRQTSTMRKSSTKHIDIEKLALNRFRRASIDPSKAALRTLMERLLDPAQAAINQALNKWDDDALWKMCQDAKQAGASDISETTVPTKKSAGLDSRAAEEVPASDRTNTDAVKKSASQKGAQ